MNKRPTDHHTDAGPSKYAETMMRTLAPVCPLPPPPAGQTTIVPVQTTTTQAPATVTPNKEEPKKRKKEKEKEKDKQDDDRRDRKALKTKSTVSVNQTTEAGEVEEANPEFLQMVGKQLTSYHWYHGLMPRMDCEDLLKANGDFLVRRTKIKSEVKYIISVKHKSGGDKAVNRHIPIQYLKGGMWKFHQEKGSTIPEILDTLMREKRGPLGAKDVLLKTGIPRPDYYILHENVTKDKKIGTGAFGEVFLGSIKMKDGSEMKAAVKTIKGSVKKSIIATFIKEAHIMRRFSHPNIVRLYGVASQEEPLMILLELAPGGSLKKYFTKNGDAADVQLLSFVMDAARGMCYLSVSQVIHRDLAARNCLLGEKGELKISDFGLSVADKDELKCNNLKKVPVRWLSPETVTQGIFSTKTDVWSFGVLVWEIYNRCKSDPFPGETNKQVLEKLRKGSDPPMSLPSNVPMMVKSTVDGCFQRDPSKRIDFVSIMKELCPDEPIPEAAK